VHHRANVEAGGGHVGRSIAWSSPHEDDPTAFQWPPLEKPGGALRQPRTGKRRPGARDHLRRDRRGPGAERRFLLVSQLSFQRRRLSYSAVPTREQAWETLTRYTKSESLLRHALAVEASVRLYARLYGEDEEFWGCVALLHDFDYEIHPTLDKHPQDGAPILREEGYPAELIEAALSHAEHLNMPRDTQLKRVLFACDELSGFVHACGLVRPTGLEGLEPKSVKKKLKQPSFAAGVHRDEVYAGAELLGLELDDHIANVVAAMQPIAGELGLRTAAGAA
jgi:putative nucleotidyltransferase with HDIG domain